MLAVSLFYFLYFLLSALTGCLFVLPLLCIDTPKHFYEVLLMVLVRAPVLCGP